MVVYSEHDKDNKNIWDMIMVGRKAIAPKREIHCGRKFGKGRCRGPMGTISFNIDKNNKQDKCKKSIEGTTHL